VLAADAKVLERSGDVTSSWELGRQYGVVDADGSRPDLLAHWDEIVGAYGSLQEGFRREALFLDRIARRADEGR
jgi:hypothetical protein